MCGHHPLSLCIIRLSCPVTWTLVIPFSDCARTYIQCIITSVFFFFCNLMFLYKIIELLFYLLLLK